MFWRRKALVLPWKVLVRSWPVVLGRASVTTTEHRRTRESASLRRATEDEKEHILVLSLVEQGSCVCTLLDCNRNVRECSNGLGMVERSGPPACFTVRRRSKHKELRRTFFFVFQWTVDSSVFVRRICLGSVILEALIDKNLVELFWKILLPFHPDSTATTTVIVPEEIQQK